VHIFGGCGWPAGLTALTAVTRRAFNGPLVPCLGVSRYTAHRVSWLLGSSAVVSGKNDSKVY
jgi:hypothetical protein